MKKRCQLIIICLAWSVLLSACSNPITLFQLPFYQPNTSWVSEDGTIIFSVSPYPNDPYLVKQTRAEGTIQTNKETVQVYICGGKSTPFITVYPRHDDIDFEDETELLELWVGRMHGNRRFTVEVRSTTFLEEGQTITFYRKD
ncbi:MAG: hypothetical protein IJI06_00275 [Oscillospiraceae bacterium]|nr:hypothetical protein [Oscillospiraceae bacterium]